MPFSSVLPQHHDDDAYLLGLPHFAHGPQIHKSWWMMNILTEKKWKAQRRRLQQEKQWPPILNKILRVAREMAQELRRNGPMSKSTYCSCRGPSSVPNTHIRCFFLTACNISSKGICIHRLTQIHANIHQ